MPDIILPVDEKEYEEAGSKFITCSVPLTADNVGHTEYRNISLGAVEEKQAGVSVVFKGTIADGIDEGKAAELSAGIQANAIWKLKELLKVAGVPVKWIGTGAAKKPSFDPTATVGKKVIGVFVVEEGKKGGIGEAVYYPKLVSFLPEGTPTATETML